MMLLGPYPLILERRQSFNVFYLDFFELSIKTKSEVWDFSAVLSGAIILASNFVSALPVYSSNTCADDT